MADTTIPISLDSGKNIAEIIEKLAAQIGTTTEKIFPWYIKQQIIDGWIHIAFGAIAILLGLFFIIKWHKKADWDDGNKDTIFVVFGAAMFLIAVLFSFISFPSLIAQIINPDYYALKAMTADMARLIH